MIPNQNILTELTASFKLVAENAVALLTPTATYTLIGITIIAIVTTTLYYLAIEDSRSPDIMFYVKQNLPILFRYASFTFIIIEYNNIINAIVTSFFKIGGLAGGTPISDKMFSSPSVISETGLKLMIPIWENYVSSNIGKILYDLTLFIAGAATGGWTSIIIKAGQGALGAVKPNSIFIMFLMAAMTLIIIGCFFFMAVNVFVIQIELAIVASLFIILIPFGVWGDRKNKNSTYFIFDNASSTFINIGIKYMVLTTILSISMAIITTLNLGTSPSYQELLLFFLMIAGITAMTIFLPSRIAAELQG